MKRAVIALAALWICLLCACGSGGASPPREGPVETAAEPETAIKPEAGGETPEENPIEAPLLVAELSKSEIYMSLPVFEDWEFELVESDGPGIRFWRTGDLKGYAELLYYDMFGVCGMGLEEREAEFPSGQPARIGYYDGESDWSFVIFDADGMEGDYAAVNHGLTGGDAMLALSMLGQAAIG